jgi:site-specific DNA-methyltransferase (adenine-specific)
VRTQLGTLPQPSRLFYCPKANRTERDAGCEALPRQALDLFPNAQSGRRPPAAANTHPTVKPLALMCWLVRLIAPEGGLVCDPFCGSGTTGAAATLESRRFIGIEREPGYATIAKARIAHWENQAGSVRTRALAA